MAPATSVSNDEENVDFLLTVIMTADAFEPNFETAAAKFDIKERHNAQRKFKFIVEKSGKYECKKNVITDKDAPTLATTAAENGTNDGNAESSIPSTPKSKASKKRATSAVKSEQTPRKRAKKGKDAEFKIQEGSNDIKGEEDDGGLETVLNMNG